MQKDWILQVKNLDICFTLRGRRLHALRDISLNVQRGESLAIVGESGSGKSVLAKSLLGLLDANGRIVNGQILYNPQNGEAQRDLATLRSEKDWLPYRGGEIAIVMQDPLTSLNPLMTIGKQITEALRIHQNQHGEAAKKAALAFLDDVGITEPERRLRQHPHEFSGGMRQRVAIAIAMACHPRILICDEPTTALDVTIQAQILGLIKRMQLKYGLTTIYITHDLGVVANIADRIAVMYAGDFVEIGACEEIFYDSRHPYTWALLSSLPQLGSKGGELYTIAGTPPNLFEETTGDAFAPRNPRALEIDFLSRPPIFEISPTHSARTWLLDSRAPKVDPPPYILSLRERRNLQP